MSIGRVCNVCIMRLFQFICNFVRNLCGRTRSHIRADMDELPFEVVVSGEKREEHASLLQNASMDSWDDTDWDKKEEVNDKIEKWRQTNTQKVSEASNGATDDMFNSLEPTITTTRKVFVKPRAAAHSAPKRNLFEFNEENMGASSTLGEIDDDLMAWGDDIDSTLKQHRDEQNKQRQLEHERRLAEKRIHNTNSNLL